MSKKLVFITLAVLLVAALAGIATYAWFTDSAAVSGNTFTAGTLNIDITNQTPTMPFEFTNLAPGDTVTGTITVKNTGTLPLQYYGYITIDTQTAGQDGDGANLADVLEMTFTPTDVRGAGAPGSADLPDPMSGIIRDLQYSGIGIWTPVNMPDQPFGAGWEVDYDVEVHFPIEAGNEYQGAGLEGTIRFYADQWTNPQPFPRLGMVLWLDAATGITLDPEGRVTEWADRSGFGNNFVTKSTNSSPYYDAAGINGKPVVKFTKGQYLRSDWTISRSQDTTVFVVIKYDTLGTRRIIDSRTSLNDYWGIRGDGDQGNASRIQVYRSGHERRTVAYYEGASGIVLTSRYTNSPRDTNLFINGVSTALENGANSSSGDPGNTYLGSRLEDRDTLIGDIAEVIIYNRALSDTERDTVEAYLKDKYGL